MTDKVDTNHQFNIELERKIVDLGEYVKRHNAKLKQDPMEPQPTIDDGEILWHCLQCGKTWKGWEKVNPTPPSYCAGCKKHSWNELPKTPHATQDGKPCKYCQIVINRKLEVLKRLQEMAEEIKNPPIESTD